VGFLPVFFPPEGCLGHAPVHTQPGPVDALQAIVVEQSHLPELEEDALLDPLLEAIVGGGPGTELGGVQGLPLATGAEDEEDGIGTDPVGGAWFAAAKGVRVRVFRDAYLHELPEFIRDTPVVGNGVRVHA
jgi:hypothetical protein